MGHATGLAGWVEYFKEQGLKAEELRGDGKGYGKEYDVSLSRPSLHLGGLLLHVFLSDITSLNFQLKTPETLKSGSELSE